jgi:diguanylate cyclase (GGDEF)-like protein
LLPWYLNMSLNFLARCLALVMMLATLTGVGRVAWVEWRALRQANLAESSTGQLRLALWAVEHVSRERGPTNGVLGDATPPNPDRHAALVQARQRSDEAFNALERALPTSAARSPSRNDLRRELLLARAALDAARTQVDRTAALDHAQRDPQAIRSAVYGMVAVVPMLAPIGITLAREAQQALPALSEDTQSAWLAAQLREYAGLLGSHFTAALARQQPLTTDERWAIERTHGRIDQLRFLIELRMLGTEHDATVQTAWDVVVARYFGEAEQLLAGVIHAGQSDGQYGMDAAQFAARYVPLMNHILSLRDAMMDRAQARAQAEHQRAERVLVVVAINSVMLLAVLVAAALLLRRRVLQPLRRTTQILRSMADGEGAPLALPKPVANDEMAAVIGAVRQLQERNAERAALAHERDELIERLRLQSETDFLTGLLNRRAFLAAAERALAQAERDGHDLALAVLDMDHFKQLNDSLGHLAGDQALVSLATSSRNALRAGDMAARFGGEEFVVLLPHCNSEQAQVLANRLCQTIATTPIVTPSGSLHRVTASIGVAGSADCGLRLDTLLEQADKAMYRAKQGGRNQVAMACTEPPPAPVAT